MLYKGTLSFKLLHPIICFTLLFLCEFLPFATIIIIIDTIRSFPYGNPSLKKSPLKETPIRNHGEKDMSSRKVMWHVNMKALFLKEFKPYVNINRGFSDNSSPKN